MSARRIRWGVLATGKIAREFASDLMLTPGAVPGAVLGAVGSRRLEAAQGFAAEFDGEPVRIEGAEPVIGRGYGNEIAEVGRCLREGLLESPLVPLAQTVLIMRQIEDVLRQIGAGR